MGTVKNFFNHPSKIALTRDAFASFGFLPLVSFTGLIPIIGELAIRLIPTKSFFQSYTLTMHYNVYLGVFLSLATLFALISVKRWLLPRYRRRAHVLLLCYLLVLSLLMARKITYSPINMLISRVFWKELPLKKDFFSYTKKIPSTGSILSQNNLLSHFITRKEEVFLFSDAADTRTDIVVFDVSDSSPNNFWPSTEEKVRGQIALLLKNTSYTRVQITNQNLFIFFKK